MPKSKYGPCWTRCGRSARKENMYCAKCWKAKKAGALDMNTSVYHLPGNP